jgi:hypothetical protein
VLCCRGTRPSQAAKSRPRSKASPVPIAATMAVEISGPIPGTPQPPALGLGLAEFFNVTGDGLDALVEAAPVVVESADQLDGSRRDLVPSVLQIAKSELRSTRAPALTAMPCSIRKARIWLIVAVRRETSRDRTRWQACRSS